MTSRTRERERERDQTHSYWYIPSALRENYSLLIMESIGMMNMVTGEGLPLRQGARMGPDWFSVAIEASGGGTPDLLCSPKFLGCMGIYGRKKYVGGPPGCPRGRGARPGGWARPPPSWTARDSSGPTLLFQGLVLVHKNHQKMAR